MINLNPEIISNSLRRRAAARDILNKKFRLDIIIENVVVAELKASDGFTPLYQAQVLSHMKLSKYPKGLLINFNVVNLVKEGLIPLVNQYFSALPLNKLLIKILHIFKF